MYILKLEIAIIKLLNISYITTIIFLNVFLYFFSVFIRFYFKLLRIKWHFDKNVLYIIYYAYIGTQSFFILKSVFKLFMNKINMKNI